MERKDAFGRCSECGEMTSLDNSCCGAPIEINGVLIPTDGEDVRLGFPRQSGGEKRNPIKTIHRKS